MRKAFECHFHSEEQVRGYLDTAEAILSDYEMPEALRVELFPKLVDLLAQKQVTFEQVAPPGVLLNQRPQG